MATNYPPAAGAVTAKLLDTGEPVVDTLIPPDQLLTRDGRPARELWALEPQTVHLNHGSYGAAPKFTIEHREQLLREVDANPLRWHIGVQQRIAEAKSVVAPFIGLEPREFAFLPNTSTGTTAVLRELVDGPVLLTDHAYGALAGSARATAERLGAEVRVVHVPLEAEEAEAVARIEAELTSDIRLIALDQVTSATARMLPVAQIARIARERGIRVLVDAAHAPGMLAQPVITAADAWVGNLHKFACGVRGTAVIHLNGVAVRPPTDSWGVGSEFPTNWDEQGTIDATAYLATTRGISHLEEHLGWDRIRAYQHELLAYAIQRIAEAFQSITGENHLVDVGMAAPAMGLVRLPAGLATTSQDGARLRQRIADELAIETQIPSWRGIGMLRVSVHAYTRASDIEQFVERAVPALCAWAREA